MGKGKRGYFLGQIKILIADDHALVREGTRQILEQEPDLEVVAEAADGKKAVKPAGSSKPDDVSLPTLHKTHIEKHGDNIDS